MVKKLGHPLNPEFAIGAITETGEGVFSEETISAFAIPQEYIDRVVEEESKEAARRLNDYRQGRPPRQLAGKRVVIVDDGVATGSTLRAAIKTVQAEKAEEITVAVPVAPVDTKRFLEGKVDKVICLATPSPFYAIGQFYTDFGQTTDDEVMALLT